MLPVWIILVLYRFCIIGFNLNLTVKPFTNLIRFYLSTVEISRSTQCTSVLDSCAAFVFHCDHETVCHQRHSLPIECAIQKRICGAKYPFWLPPFTRGKNLHLRRTFTHAHNSFLVCALKVFFLLCSTVYLCSENWVANCSNYPFLSSVLSVTLHS